MSQEPSNKSSNKQTNKPSKPEQELKQEPQLPYPEQPYSYQELIKLQETIMNLSTTDWESICKHILIPNDENITINKNGVLFNLVTLSPKSIHQIHKHIEHIEHIKHKIQ